jgi:fatty acid desaturase
VKDASAHSTPGARQVVAAYALVRDLMRPSPARYWGELLLCGSAAWLAFLVAVVLPLGGAGMWFALLAAALLFYRASIFIHELTHQHRKELPGFHLAWNLFIGVPLLLPSVLYEGVHKVHHAKATYGTSNDPEYLPFASRPALALAFLVAGLLAPLYLFIRFFIDAPISWAAPRFRGFVERRASAFCMNPLYSRTMTAEERRRLFHWEIVLLAVWTPFLAATIYGWLPWKWLPLWYVMYAALATINHARELVAHRYRSDGQPLDHAGQLRDTLDTPGACWTVLWAPLGLRFHALHHLFPRLPYHNLAEAHRRLIRWLPAEAMYRRSRNPSFLFGLRRLFHGAGITSAVRTVPARSASSAPPAPPA